MKKFLCFLVFVLSFPAYPQYMVVLRCGHISNPWNPIHPTEWRMDGHLYADIFDSNNNLIPPSQGFVYLWERDYCDGNNFQFWDETYNTTNYVTPDGNNNTPSACDPNVVFQTYYVRVTVTIDREHYPSDEIRLPDNESGTTNQNLINLTQKRNSQQIIGVIGKDYYNRFFNYPVPISFYYPQPVTNDYYRATQDLATSPLEKYNHWMGITDVINHRNFTFTGAHTYLTSQLYPVQSQISIQNSLEGTSLNSGEIKFADPWYIDYRDNIFYGNNWRNRGMDNPRQFYIRSVGTNGWQPDFTTVYQESPYPYNGVFLNQTPDPNNPAKPYYSVQALTSQSIPLGGTLGTRNFQFFGWDYEEDEISTPNKYNNPTAVVFKTSDATISAVLKGHL